jgi:hypothetical protein
MKSPAGRYLSRKWISTGSDSLVIQETKTGKQELRDMMRSILTTFVEHVGGSSTVCKRITMWFDGKNELEMDKRRWCCRDEASVMWSTETWCSETRRLLEDGFTCLKHFLSLFEVVCRLSSAISNVIRLTSFAGWVSAGRVALVIQTTALAGST